MDLNFATIQRRSNESKDKIWRISNSALTCAADSQAVVYDFLCFNISGVFKMVLPLPQLLRK